MRSLAAAFLLLLGAAVPAEEAPKAPPVPTGYVETVTVQLAQMNFLAVDRGGNPVADLRADEIEIVDGGEKQSVAFLQPYYRPAGTGASAAPATPPPPPLEGVPAATAQAPAAAASSGRWFALVFDNYLTSQRTRLESIEAARAFVAKRLQPADRAAIVVFDGKLHLLQSFTGDGARLQGALDKALGLTERAAGDRNSAIKGLLDAMEHCSDLGANASREICAQQLVDQYEDSAIRETDALTDALALVVRSVGAISDTKAVVLFSEGFARVPGQDVRDAAEAVLGSDVSRYVRARNVYAVSEKLDAIVAAAAAAKVSFFTINPGVGSRLSFISAADGRFANNRTNVLQVDPYRNSELNAQHSLAEMAQRTGGVALTGSDVERELDRVDALSPALYTVGYYPTVRALAKSDRDVKIRILRRGVRAEFRREVPRGLEPAALSGAMEVESGACGTDGRRLVTLRVRVDRQSLSFSRMKQNVVANFSMFVRVLAEGTGASVFDEYRLFNITNSGEEVAAGGIPDPSLEQSLAVPCVPLTLRVTVTDGASGGSRDFTAALAE